MKIVVLGAGAWGTALAVSAAAHAGGNAVTLWARDEQQAAAMQAARCNQRYLPGLAFAPALQVVAGDARALAASAELIVIGTPMAALRGMLQLFKDSQAPIAWLCKGFEAGTGLMAHEVCAEVAPQLASGVLSGPSFAQEVARAQPTALVAASRHEGVRQALEDGVVGGFPVHDVRVIVHDGKSHSVDSKDIAFYTAGRKATIEAIRAATPIILEPVVEIEILAPDEAVGDLAGDLSSKRGQVTGTQPRGVGSMAIGGKVPLAELDDYQGRLKSLTGGQGSYTIAFSHYAPVPANVQHTLSAQYKAVGLDDE